MIGEAGRERPSADQRRERSRLAARCRRDKETEMFQELAQQLPLPRRISSHLDKASVMRMTLSFLRIRTLLSSGDLCGSAQGLGGQQMSVLDGFFLVLSQNGDIVFLCENVSKYVGLTQLELIGQNIFDYTHPCDHQEMHRILGDRQVSQTPRAPGAGGCDFFVRFKCTLTLEGKMVNLRSASWKVLRCSGAVKTRQDETADKETTRLCLFLICEPIPLPPIAATLTHSKTFLTCHSLDMKFSHLDHRAELLLGYEEGELLGLSVYEILYPLDSNRIKQRHRSLFAKGQTSTGPYRMLVKHGGFIWVESDSSIIYHHQTSQPQSILCVNYILSCIEHRGLVLSLVQRGISFKSCSIEQQVGDETQQLYQGVKDTYLATETECPYLRVQGRGVPDPSEDPPPIPFTRNIHLASTPLTPSNTPEALSSMDLETLAPYIPMEDQDFQLGPVLPKKTEIAPNPRPLAPSPQSLSSSPRPSGPARPSFCKWWETEAVFPLWGSPSSSFSPSQDHARWNHPMDITPEFLDQPSVRCGNSWSARDRDTGPIPSIPSSGLKRKREAEFISSSLPPGWGCEGPTLWKKTKMAPDLAPATGCCPEDGHNREWNPVFSKTLPVLSCVDCEVNAPLQPQAQLLQGQELLNVLD